MFTEVHCWFLNTCMYLVWCKVWVHSPYILTFQLMIIFLINVMKHAKWFRMFTPRWWWSNACITKWTSSFERICFRPRTVDTRNNWSADISWLWPWLGIRSSNWYIVWFWGIWLLKWFYIIYKQNIWLKIFLTWTHKLQYICIN